MRIAIAAFALVLAACASTGDGEPSAILGGTTYAHSVAPCTTSFTQIERVLGPPSRDGRLGTTRIATWIVEWEPLVKYLGVMLDDTGRVVDVYWDIPTEVPWTPVNRCE